MSELPQIESSNDVVDNADHVEMTNETSTERESIEAEAVVSGEESAGEHDAPCVGTPSKESQANRSFSSDEETHLNSPWGSSIYGGPRSTSSNSSWGTAIYTDMRFTMVSNLCFFIGACIQTYTSIVDLKDAKEAALEDDDDWDDDYDDDKWDDEYDDDDWCDDDYVYTVADKSYYVLYSIGPLLYIINALIDVRWLKEQAAYQWSCLRGDNSSVQPENSEQQQVQYHRIIEVHTNNTEDMNTFDDDGSCSASSVDTSYKTEANWQLVAAVVFGIGALFEFYSTFLDDYYQDEDEWDDDAYLIKMENKRKWYVSNYKIDTIGMHLYLLSGVIMLIAQRNSYRSGWQFGCCFRDIRRECFSGQQDDEDEQSRDIPVSTNPTESSNRLAQLLMFLGTILFVCGTLLDCTISWMSDPAVRHDVDPTNNLNEMTLSIFDLISSLLWNVDAVLYICADVLLYSLHKKGSKGRQWLFKKRVRCNCMEADNEDMEEDQNGQEYLRREDRSPLPMLPDLGRHNRATQPLLGRGSSITSYSSL